jgi:glutathione synthase
MKIAFVVNDIEGCQAVDTTVGLGMSAANRGHDVFFTTVGDAIYYSDENIGARTIHMNETYKTYDEFVEKLKDKNAKKLKIHSDDLDVLFLRNNPSEDMDRPWAKFAGILFGQLAVRQGVLVLNHPDTLAYAHVDKMYFEHFPEAIRPASIITRHLDDIEEFFKKQKYKMILKPLEGSGGKDVFLVDKKEGNLKQIVEAISRSGYVIAQRYLPQGKDGDIRLFMMNGKPMKYKGKYAAFRRMNEKDFRSNMHTGGKALKAEIDDKILKIAEILGPKLIQDGIFCAGLDIVGDKLIELNITSPGGLSAAGKLEDVDFNEAMIIAIENKLVHKKHYGNSLTNKELAIIE